MSLLSFAYTSLFPLQITLWLQAFQRASDLFQCYHHASIAIVVIVMFCFFYQATSKMHLQSWIKGLAYYQACGQDLTASANFGVSPALTSHSLAIPVRSSIKPFCLSAISNRYQGRKFATVSHIDEDHEFTMYFISSHGEVFSLYTRREMAYRNHGSRYFSVNLSPDGNDTQMDILMSPTKNQLSNDSSIHHDHNPTPTHIIHPFFYMYAYHHQCPRSLYCVYT
ncbi:predicted protein [Lichtheimia corymbifera JMRC:FSU:9682]|uniref:Uncharacterized protein n=1 Tax=Lichtheimia corymbifera JMRC:FSU:9682 TaxID=1263082 RepID=A0A068RHY2_9FUNG|nr:predicted protein [Lichtheimia corymbifera JMRC:FSU:9682]